MLLTIDSASLRGKYLALASRLDEPSRRLWAAAEAIGPLEGLALVSRATGLTRKAIAESLRELRRLPNSAAPARRRAETQIPPPSGTSQGTGYDPRTRGVAYYAKLFGAPDIGEDNLWERLGRIINETG